MTESLCIAAISPLRQRLLDDMAVRRFSSQPFNRGCHMNRHKRKPLFSRRVYEIQSLTLSVNDADVDTKLARNSTD